MLEERNDEGEATVELTEEELEEQKEKELARMMEERQTDPAFQPPHLEEGIPPVTCAFGKADYWDGRYRKSTEVFEWYKEYDECKHIINQYCARDGRVLMAGCGNSRLSADMYFDGYEDIENADISRVLIDQMKTKYDDLPGLQWKQMDMCDLPYEDASFDCCIDKATLDCVFCADLALKKVRKYVHEMDRVLKHGGAWVILSCGNPESRLEHFENPDSNSIDFLSFECNVHALPKPLLSPYAVPDLRDPDQLYFIYVCIKNPVKSKQKDDKKNRVFLAKEGKKALAKKLRDQRTKINEEGQFAKTPTRDAFGNPRTSDWRIKKTEEQLAQEAEEKALEAISGVEMTAEAASAIAPAGAGEMQDNR
jgi:SAM-dependent methyltransferase